MKKSDLKDGYLVKCRDGNIFEIRTAKIDNKVELVLINNGGRAYSFYELSNYDENLNSSYNSKMDIMKVYDYSKNILNITAVSTDFRDILWERKEEPEKDGKPVELSINDFAKAVHENAVAHGWWDKESSFAEIIALCHSELSEALEDDRQGISNVIIANEKFDDSYVCGKAVEMIDCVLRILDWCAKEGVDIEKIMTLKHEYNKTRPYKHGKKY